MGYRVGVDIGGSFTDFAVLDENTFELTALKVFSRPDEPGAEVVAGLEGLRSRYKLDSSLITYLTHGTTVGVNTVIQRKGLNLALFATRNFTDVLELARLRQPDMFDLLSKRPVPLIPRDMVFGVDERILADGSIAEPVDEESVKDALRRAKAAGAEGVIVALLHAYANPSHEKAILRMIENLAPELPVVCSHRVWPILREYERTITATISGYVQPRVAHYLSSLQHSLKNAGISSDLRVTKSNGGVMSAEKAKTDCVQIILSGTASGVIGAHYVAQLCSVSQCMSLDVGGTSADVALIEEEGPQYGVGEYIGDFQIFIPSVSVTSIGDGGGSIAWVDDLGVLHVGPESAGSDPGPACFGRGGKEPTITDAFAVCGMIGQTGLGYEAVTVDIEAARTAVEKLAGQLRITTEETAEAIIRVALSGMYSKVSALITRFGVDPTEMPLLAFGGAGPMLGCFLARELGMTEIIVPTAPGVLSALGGLIADVKNDFIKTVYLDLNAEAAKTMSQEFEELERSALEWLRDEQGYGGEHAITCSADMRYKGQSFELETELSMEAIKANDCAVFADSFHRAHQQMYGHNDPNAPVQVISVRLVISGKTPKPGLRRLPRGNGEPKPLRLVDIWLDGTERQAPLYDRKDLLAGHRFTGPAIIGQDDCTTCVPSGFTVVVDDYGNLRVRGDITP